MGRFSLFFVVALGIAATATVLGDTTAVVAAATTNAAVAATTAVPAVETTAVAATTPLAFVTTTTTVTTTTVAAPATTTPTPPTPATIPETTTLPSTTLPPTASCAAISPQTVMVGVTTLFQIGGMNINNVTCSSVNMTFFLLPTTTPAPTTTAGPTTTIATTTTVATTTPATTTMTTTVAPTTTTGPVQNTTTAEPTTTTPMTTTAVTTTTPATTTPPTTTTIAPTTTTMGATTQAPTALIQPLFASASSSSRQFVFSPQNIGPYQVDLQCNGINVALCGRFFSSSATDPITFAFNGNVPNDVPTFSANFANAVATASNILPSQVSNIHISATRRRSGFAVSTQLLGSISNNDPQTAFGLVNAAAAAGNLNSQFQSVLGTTATAFSFGGSSFPIAPPQTPAPTPLTPSPPPHTNAAMKNGPAMLSTLALLVAAALYLFF